MCGGDLGDVDSAARVDREAVGRHELPHSFAERLRPQVSENLTFR